MVISLKQILIVSAIVLTPTILKAQNYNPVLNYSFSGTPTNGVKIKTNIPFTHGLGMPTIIIEGYNYEESSPIGLIVNWYVYDNQFINYGVSSFGAYTPEVKLAQENGKVVVFINEKKYYNRFTARAFAIDKGESSNWFSDWNIADESLSGSNTVILPYKNTVGELKFPGGIINNKGQVGIGTNDPQYSLDVSGSSQLGDFVSGGTNSWIFHTPDDGRKTLHIAPKKNQEEWDWAKQLVINGENGNVGIGIGSPSEKLEVIGSVYSNNEDSYIGIDANGESRLGLVKKAGYGPIISSGSNSPITFGSWSTPDIRNNITSGNFKELFKITPVGNASLQGKLEAKEIKVTNSPTADFVFEDTYQLPKLENVEKHIKEKKHLPEIASAAQMQKEGVNIGEFQIKLLQKIEELTLYSIEQNKLIKELHEKVRQLQELQKKSLPVHNL